MGSGGLVVDAMSIGCRGVDRRGERFFVLSHLCVCEQMCALLRRCIQWWCCGFVFGDMDSCRDVPYKVMKFLVFRIISSSLGDDCRHVRVGVHDSGRSLYLCVCVYYCRTYYKAVRGGGEGGEWRTSAMRDDEPRPVWMSPLIMASRTSK
jgi:hypothetical protein